MPGNVPGADASAGARYSDPLEEWQWTPDGWFSAERITSVVGCLGAENTPSEGIPREEAPSDGIPSDGIPRDGIPLYALLETPVFWWKSKRSGRLKCPVTSSVKLSSRMRSRLILARM